MPDYLPIDLPAHVTRSVDFHPTLATLPAGDVELHGLPFRFGDASGARVLGFEVGDTAPVDIPIGAAPRTLLFAHAMTESDLAEGGHIGQQVATYTLVLADGEPVDIPIRERYEIGALPADYGQWPFLAEVDRPAARFDSHSGPWELAGTRWTGMDVAWPTHVFLYAWQFPEAASEVVSVRVQPRSRGFYLAGLTLGFLDEWPFPVQARKDVRLTLLGKGRDAAVEDWSVDVDRGSITRAHVLSPRSTDDFVSDVMRGWGDEVPETAEQQYVRVAAVPSARLAASSGAHGVDEGVRWGDLEADGDHDGDDVRFELLDRGKNWVRVTVRDAATGELLPCRIHLRTPEGIPYAPHTHHDHVLDDLQAWNVQVDGDVRLGHVSYAYIDGTCQGWLPRGQVVVDVACGFEYWPLRRVVTISDDQDEVHLELERMTDVRSRGWHGGDTHVHFTGTQAAMYQARGEGLDVVNLLAAQWGQTFAKSRTSPAVSTCPRTARRSWCARRRTASTCWVTSRPSGSGSL